MTFRTRTAPAPSRRRTRRSDTRRAVYITISFSLAIAAALSLMGGVFVASYYQDHGAPIAGVSGEGISKDTLNSRIALNIAHFDRQLADYQTMRNQGKITTDEFAAVDGAIRTAKSTLKTDALTQLVNETQLRQYATKNNISVSDQQIDAQIKIDSTIPEMRHVKIISVPATATAPSSAPTKADGDAAKAKAESLLKEIQGGKAWADVDTEADTQGASSGTGGGDKGLVTKDVLAVDPELADAIFNLNKTGDITAIIKGSDGSYRFATVTNIVAEWTDADWESTITAASSKDAYRDFAKNIAIKTAIQDQIEAKYVTGATQQSKVLQIAVATGPYAQLGDGDEVKIAMIVIAPGGSVAGASAVTADDPKWAKALTDANALVAKLRADPSKFAATAADKTVNNDTSFNDGGGDVPWIPSSWFQAAPNSQATGLGMLNVEAAVYKPGIAAGTILDPIKEDAAGYVIVQLQGRRPAPTQRIADALFAVNNGTPFADVAKALSESSDAPTGGDLGWVSPYMLAPDQLRQIDATPVGRVSNIVSVSGNSYIYLVLDRQTRVADPDIQTKLKKVVFGSWLSEFQANALVWKDAATVAALASATPAQ